ncbi:MAG: ferritin, partial [Chloroflexota bacterium]
RASESNILLVEDHLARTTAAVGGVDPTAPAAAGGAL